MVSRTRSLYFFGETALLDDGSRSATVVSTDELHVMKLPRRPFLELVEEHGGVALTMMTELRSRVRRLERQPAPSVS